jgi:hypothetical protein
LKGIVFYSKKRAQGCLAIWAEKNDVDVRDGLVDFKTIEAEKIT